MMKKYQFTVLIEQDEDGVYVAKVPQLRGCHTQGKSVEQALDRIREAIDLCLEVEKDELVPTRFVGVQQIEVAA
ncbi:MAG: type II toxin-antitoxin system HicB family antitoxin [Candidatus Altiarchaeales archaeon]|nr:type II toxin-antitoxin system HicB family antitoxin [Candidatus Altiarchaeales archaeon]